MIFEALEKVSHYILDAEFQIIPAIVRSHSKMNLKSPYLSIQTPNRTQIGLPTNLPLTSSEDTVQTVVNDFECSVIFREVGDEDYLGVLSTRLYDSDVVDTMEEYGLSVYEVEEIVDIPTLSDADFIQERVCNITFGIAFSHLKAWATGNAVVAAQSVVTGSTSGSAVHDETNPLLTNLSVTIGED